ncbi:MAG TPA: class I SAM-dependent methyltransferase [Ktedonobacteraceae bacterium]|nr:class I SAM-dependent methyltransferase [Ktedonobacteraceae bacterium]
MRKWLFETLYKNRYLYRFASTVPFAGQWRTWQRLVLARLHGTDVLELGCGLGDLLVDMLQRGYHCQAIEQSPEMVAAARATLQKRGVGQPTLVMQGSAQSLPFSSGTFDSVVSTFPSEYIHDPNTISEVARVLRPDGRLIVIEGANLLPSGMIQPLLLLVHLLVYGPKVIFGPRPHVQRRAEQQQAQANVEAETEEVITEVVPDAQFGRFIPLERCGLRRHSEWVHSPRWEAYVTIGEKKSVQP